VFKEGMKLFSFLTKSLKNFLRIIKVDQIFYSTKEFWLWYRRDFTGNSPNLIKKRVLRKLSNGTIWIETGTYYGGTARYLSRFASKVFTIEPSQVLFQTALRKSKKFRNIEFLNGTSEEMLSKILDLIPSGSRINLWLDGHYSEGNTYLGKISTPIKSELSSIELYRGKFKDITIFIDDVRCFNPTIDAYKEYPDLNYLVNWSNKYDFDWHIEHDIFIMKKK
jgi:hypothetical protein